MSMTRSLVRSVSGALTSGLLGASGGGGTSATSILTGVNAQTGSWVDNGDGSFTNSGAAGNEFLDIGVDAGAGGEITLNFTLTGDNVDVDYFGTGTAYEETNVPAGSHTYVETVTSSITAIRFRAKSGESMTISNISVTM